MELMTTRLRRLRALDAGDRRLLIRAAIAVALVRVGLAVLPLRLVRTWTIRCAHTWGRGGARAAVSAARIGWAVSCASRYVADATCLAQAVAGEMLLVRHGHAAELRIGAARAGDTGLEAHAWVESEGRVVLGGADLARFRALPPLP
jgi:hypothetical protein